MKTLRRIRYFLLGFGLAVSSVLVGQDGPGPDPGPGSGSPAGSTFATQYNAGSSIFGGTGPGTSGHVLVSNGAASAPTYQAAPAAGADTRIQYNDGGVLNGDSAFTFNETTDAVTSIGAFIGEGTSGATLNGWSFNATSTNPGYAFRETDAAADSKAWDCRVSTAVLTCTLWSDNYGASANWMTLTRSTQTPATLTFSPTTFAADPGGGTDEVSVTSGDVNIDATFDVDAGGGTDEINVTSGAVLMPGTLRVNGNVGFNGATPAARPDYTCTNATTDRSIDANATTLDEVADVLCTVIADQIALGLFQ